MRAKFVTAGIEDVGLMVTIITRFRRGSFSIGTLEEGPRGNMAEGGAVKGGAEYTAKSAEQEERILPQPLSGAGHCKWFNVRMGFGFISMTSSEGSPLDLPLDVFVHQSKLVMDGFRSLKEGEQVEFTFKKSSKGLECLRVTGPGGGPCTGSERRPKGKATPQKNRKQKGDRPLSSCYNCGGLDHHAKECGLPPQPKKCHYCQSIMHMVAQCPQKALAPPTGSQDPLHSSTLADLYPPDEEERSGSYPLDGPSTSPEEPPQSHCGGPQRWRK
ncbi:protein lin-28 homolog A isoform X1 [Salmo salar]|uniref:Protein lin-28 homolog A isoform X1 n=1 Tax=Salmo salar TaxID=8030 RepID=A0A1S3S6V3_SALSA|nr:protein lin-28 homolog A-like isoform X1 [Salmo salar]|eukprot:XP_014060071.1 PREDICTED: protein lin-28 homolog A-like isoform X1 [Salmo salar]